MVESTLGELLVRAEGATSLHSNKDGIPPIKQGLAALQQRTADLAFTGHTVQGTEQNISRARQFLPSGHTDDVSRLVTSLERKPAFQPAPRAKAPGVDLELESFLDGHYQHMIQKAIDEAQEAAEAAAHRAEIRWEEEDWREAKLDFRKAKQVSAGTALLEQTLALTSQFDGGYYGPGGGDQQQQEGGGGAMDVDVNPQLTLGMIPRAKSKLSNVQLEYATKIGEATNEDQREGLAQLLFLAADRLAKDSQGVSADAEEFRRTLKLLRSMLEQVSDDTGYHVPILDEAQGPEAWREVLAMRARQHLEREIWEVVDTRTRKALHEGRVRLPTEGPRGILEAYVEYRTSKATHPSGLPVPNPYEVLYLFLRTGKLQEAVHYVHNAQGTIFPVEVYQAVAGITHAITTNPLSSPSSALTQAIGRIKDLLCARQESEDVFEKAVLNLLAFDNPNKVDKQRVVNITEDYLWHCLWFTLPINPANADPSPSQGRFTIFDLAAKILRWGEQHFDPDGGRAFLYASILFICQLFREGVSHLYKNKNLAAVHTAILLDRYSLFRDLSRSEAVPPRGYVMNLEDMVLGYVKDFQDSDVEKAADYLLVIKPWGRMKKMVEVLLEVTDEEAALPRLAAHLKAKRFTVESVVRSPDGKVRRAKEAWDTRQALEVIKVAAVTAERSLSSRKALTLYKLAEDDTGALRVLNKQLCQVVVTPNSDREVWWKEVAYFENKRDSITDANLLATLDSLNQLYRFFDIMDQRDYDAARTLLENNVKVFPLVPDSRALESSVSTFMASSIEFKRVLGEAAVRAMMVYVNLNKERKRQSAEARPTALSREGQGYQQAGAMGQEQQALQMQVRAKALLKWCLDLRVERDLPSEVVSRMQRLEANIM